MEMESSCLHLIHHGIVVDMQIRMTDLWTQHDPENMITTKPILLTPLFEQGILVPNTSHMQPYRKTINLSPYSCTVICLKLAF